MTDTRESGSKARISFMVNGDPKTVGAYPMERLLDVLRQQLQLTGTKEGCGEGECGSCSVLMDGMLVNSCLIPVLQAQGSSIVTIEGIAAGDTLHILQQTFLDHGGAQCGICTPGMILAAAHLLNRNPEPTLEEIREGLSGNLCRCTGYSQIVEAVAEASRRKATA
jgi:aerobic carbon-monoxide dehydrogenase small subunit